MSELAKRLADYSPEKRRLLLKRLREMSGKKDSAEGTGRSGLVRRSREGRLPLSFSQQRLWFLDQLLPGNPAYNLVTAVEIEGRLDVAVLAAAIDEIVSRHESLRTTFVAARSDREEPSQIVHPHLEVPLSTVDATRLTQPAHRAEVDRVIHDVVSRPYELSRGPLVRVRLVRASSRRFTLVVGMHHIVSDGWSFGVFIREVRALYEACAEGRPSPLGELAVQYADFALWQRERLAGEILERELDYWRRRLAGAPRSLELPTDRPRPPIQSFDGAMVPIRFGRELGESLKSFCQERGVTLFMTLLAAYQSLLSRYTGATDLVVGSPIAGRNQLEIEGLIGFFINTLALRTDLAGNPAFGEVVERVRDVTRSAYDHQDLPFEKLVQEIQPSRNLNQTPLFQVVFSLQNTPRGSLELSGLTLKPLTIDMGTARFDLTLFVEEGPELLEGALEYNSNLFDGSTARRAVRHLLNLLHAALSRPGERFSALPLLSPEEGSQVLSEWNDTAAAAPAARRIEELFARRAARCGDALAVTCAKGHLSYRELDVRSNRLARQLEAVGVGAGALVGVLLGRSADMVVTLLAVLKAGAAYVPLDPRLPDARMRWILEEMEIPALVAGGALLRRVGGWLGELPELREVVCTDGAFGLPPAGVRVWRAEDLARQPGDPLETGAGDSLAYVIFTSGSTGTPKGVMVRHRPVLGLIDWVNRVTGMSGSDRVLFLTSLSFDLSVYDVFGILAAGGSIRVASGDEVADPESLVRILESERITFWDSAPAALSQLVPFFPSADGRRAGALRQVFLSGDWIALPLPGQVRAAFPGAAVMSLGGATEATVWSNFFPVAEIDPHWKSIPYGRPITNARYYVLDERLVPCPIGVPGDLFIGGECLSFGYAGEPVLTAGKYQPDPFYGSTGAVMYRTGDRARFYADGNVEFLGRLDHQVKIRGFRIELGEIEAVLGEHAAVETAVAAVRESTGGDKRLVAYVVAAGERGDSDVLVAQLKKLLADKLPEYMMPAAFVMLEALPVTANGKLDRNALPAPELVSASSYVAPRDEVEEKLVELWREVLDLEQLGVDDDVFEMGAHSLLATQVVSRIRQMFDVELALRLLFERPTVAALAEAVKAEIGSGAAAVPIEPIPRRGGLPLSFAQKRLWFLDQLEPGSPMYNIPAVVRASGALDMAVLASSFEEIVRRHEVLRSSFPCVSGQPSLEIAPRGRFPLRQVDLSALPEAARSSEAERLARQEARRSFDLAAGPLLGALVLALGAEENLVLLSVHHIASDAWSVGVLMRELGALYPAYAQGRPSPLPELEVQYVDFAHWQERRLRGGELEAQAQYWKRQLSPLPPVLRLPTDHPPPSVRRLGGGNLPLALTGETARSLRALGQSRTATLPMTLLAAFQVLLARYGGQVDFAVGMPIAGRNHYQTEPLIGFFVNTLVLRADLSGNPAFPALLDRVRESMLEAYTHQDYPFEKLVEELQPERDFAHSPLFQVMIVLQNAPLEALALPGLTLEPLPMDTGTAKFDLTLTLGEAEGGLDGTVEYSRDLFDKATVERLTEHFTTLLESVVADGERRVGELALMTAAERRQVEALREAAAGEPVAWDLPSRVTAQAARTPEATAVAWAGERLGFADLETRSNRLAHHLRRLGVGPEVPVAVALERSPQLVVGLLGILKAGGAYVPLDLSHPRARWALVLEEAFRGQAAPVLVTDQAAAGSFSDLADGLRTIRLDADEDVLAGEPSHPVEPIVSGDNLAYVLYTSGSTGRPKGVMVTHRGLANYLSWCEEDYQLREGQGSVVHSSVTFDLTVTGLWAPLIAGKCVRLLPEAAGIDGLADALREAEELTLVKLTPAHLDVLRSQLSPEEAGGRTRAFVIGGEALTWESVEFWLRHAPSTRLINEYGPTEAVVGCCTWEARPEPAGATVPIGTAITNAAMHLVGRWGERVPPGVVGEIHIGGAGVARGYWGLPRLSAERFAPDRFAAAPGARLYHTGDLGRYRADGVIEFLGRSDHQVKIRGFRVELGEIEAVLARHAAVADSCVLRLGAPGSERLAAYVVPGVDAPEPDRLRAEIREALRQRLPEYMVPSVFYFLEALPLTSNGKVDRASLVRTGRGGPDRAEAMTAPRSEIEMRVAAIWSELLELEKVGLDENFFDLGGHSLLVVRLQHRLREELEAEVATVDLFAHPTVRLLAERLGTQLGDGEAAEVPTRARQRRPSVAERSSDIAVIGMAGRFPGAWDLEEFWHNLVGGVESTVTFTEEELIEAGLDPMQVRHPAYVRVGAPLAGADLFDAEFFGFNPRDAQVLDPQQRVFLECAWHALEDAGYGAEEGRGAVGVFAGTSLSTYLGNLATRPDLISNMGRQLILGNDKDSLPTRVSYQLNLTGPSLSVQTNCSTSLVATHQACQSLLAGECDMALAGGVSIGVPLKNGYMYQEGGLASPDGHCRAFDARAAGTFDGNGVGAVVLKPIAAALADRDSIYAVIKASAINNDGSSKVGFTAPSVTAQASVIAEAHEMSGVDPETIGYVEAHGTATPLGDPIEIAALTRAFRRRTRRTGFCAIGSVKTNIGHLDAAAGVAGLIKTALAVHHGEVPPSLHYENPNPEIDMASSPVFVNSERRPWPLVGEVRRAGVSSFGIGGTNVHVLLEEAPPAAAPGAAKPWQLVLLSARTESALEAASERLAAHLSAHPELRLADVAYTLQLGRRAFEHRRAVVCRDLGGAVEALRGREPGRTFTSPRQLDWPKVTFLFSGLADHYAGMGRGLYETEPRFREQVDRSAELLREELGLDLREVLWPAGQEEAPAAAKEGLDLRALVRGAGASGAGASRPLDRTALAQPALFVVEYALARLFASWGVEPQAMIGYSLGEYVAACLAGVLSLEDALRLVARRARMIDGLPAGAMLAVAASEEAAVAFTGPEVSLSALTGPETCVLAGVPRAVREAERRLSEAGIACRPLKTSHAFHSLMMEQIAEDFRELVGTVELHEPKIPYVSNVTGRWIEPSQATDPDYWVEHLCRPVRFADGLGELLAEAGRIFLEVGPGKSLGSLVVQQQPAETPAQHVVVSSLRHELEREADESYLQKALGRLWLAGVPVDWHEVHDGEECRRLHLPAYPFERRSYWIERSFEGLGTAAPLRPVDDWIWVPRWQQSPPRRLLPPLGDGGDWLVYADESGWGDRLAERLRPTRQVAAVRPGSRFEELPDGSYRIDPSSRTDVEALLESVADRGLALAGVVHLWGVDAPGGPAGAKETQERGFYSLLGLAQALVKSRGAQTEPPPLEVVVVTDGLHDVLGGERVDPEKATVLGPVKVIPQELVAVRCRSVDLDSTGAVEDQVEQLAAELGHTAPEEIVAFRGRRRWVRTFERVRLNPVEKRPARLREEGVYLVTGGLGGLGLVLAGHLARTLRARLVLLGRSALPERDTWEELLATSGEDAAARRVRSVLALEEMGAEVLALSADVTDEAQVEQAFAAARKRFGGLHGVFHAAGVPGGGLIELKSRESAAEVMAPKLEGGRVLAKLCRERADLDFLLLFSSLNALEGGLGQIDYSAANAYLDQLAVSLAAESAPVTISVNWDAWQEVGMAAEAARQFGVDEWLSQGIRPREGMEVLDRLLDCPLPQVAVSTSDLLTVLENSRRQNRENVMEQLNSVRTESFPRPALDTPYEAPRSELEQTVAELWQELLGIEQIGVHDDFFELGGHSLLATQLLARLRDQVRAEVTMEDLFEHPTVARLSERVSERRDGGEVEEQLPLVPVPRDEPLPLSFAQQRLWFLQQLEPESPAYNYPLPVRFVGALDVATLQAALNEVVRRHEVLRTSFDTVEGEPYQVIAPWEPLNWPFVDLRRLDESSQGRESRRLVAEESRRTFDLARGPLLRGALLAVTDEDHVAVFNLHHIVTDGWSLGVLVREVGSLYEAASAGRPSPLPELEVQYADYAHWQRRWLSGEVLEAEIGYWRAKLAGAPPVLEVPTDRPRPAVQKFHGGMYRFSVPQALTRTLRSCGRHHDATLFMVLLAAFQAILGRYSGQDDVLVGTPVAGRRDLRTEQLIGFFVNTLVLRTRLCRDGADPSFTELLGQVREVALEADAHQDLPFEKLVEELQPERSLSHTPIFQVMFGLQNTPLEPLRLSGLTLEPVVSEESTAAKFDLTLLMAETEDGVLGELEYDRDLFDRSTVRRLADHFLVLLDDVATDPRRPLFGVALMRDAERHQLLVDWNDTELARDDLGRGFHRLFEEQAARTPEAVAAVRGADVLTYRGLDERADRWARWLAGRGVGPEVLVALLASRHLHFLTAMLAVWKAGGAYVPLDPKHPVERQHQVVRRSRAALVLADRALAADLESSLGETESAPPVHHLEELLGVGGSGERPPLVPLGDHGSHLAYVIYTSGSTGVPKGAMVEHRGMRNHLEVKIRDLDLAAGDRISETASQCFDISVWQFVAGLAVGARIHIADEDTVYDPELLLRFLERERITVFETVPSMLRGLFDSLDAGGQTLAAPLRWLMVTGEACSLDLCNGWLERRPDVPVMNAYGPTECSDDVTHHVARSAASAIGSDLPIGRPLIRFRLDVVDRTLRPAPFAVPGELTVSGAGVGRGYLGDPGRTAAVFVPDALTAEPGERLYRTGDRVRWSRRGLLEFLGRIDHQVKVRGFRIELGEIEAALARLPAVREAVVLARVDETAGAHSEVRRLVAYVVPADGGALEAGQLRAGLEDRLPEYMIPSIFVRLEALPLSANGKVDRAALPAPDLADRPEREYVAPRTEVEEKLAAAWAEVLELDRVSIHDNFFEIGGHSLSAMRIVSRVRRSLEVELPVRKLFEAPTVAGLAVAVEREKSSNEARKLADVAQRLRELSDEEVRALLERKNLTLA